MSLPNPSPSDTNEEIQDASSRCNLCGSTHFETLSHVGRGNENLTTVICRQCGLVWSHPFPIDPFNYYQKDYRILYKGVFKPKMKHVLRAARVALDRFNIVKPYLKTGLRLLDVGSGGGEFLFMARKAGCAVTGIEPNEGYAAYSKEEYGLDIHNGFLQNTPMEADAFDMVTLWHVFEHMDDPMRVLNTIHPYLKDEGLLVIEVPNVEATCQAPHNTFHTAHLFNFNHLTLQKMAEIAGFESIHQNISGDGGNICQIFKKTSAPEKPASVHLGQNFENIWKRVTGRSSFQHYLTHHPYTRLFGRLQRWWTERKSADRYSSGREILDNVLKQIQ